MDELYRSALLFVAMLFLSILAMRTFSRRQIDFAGGPAVPSMLTSRLGFNTGLLAYCLLLIAFYLVATYYWGPLKVAFGPMLTKLPWFKGLQPLLAAEGNGSDAIVPWSVAVVTTVLFTWDSKYNPFVVVLEGVLDLLQIPARAVSVYQALKLTKFGRLPEKEARAVADDPGILECRPEYFAADRRDLEYRWAHICYLRSVLLNYFRSPRYQRFFAHKALAWDSLEKSYNDHAQDIALWLEGPHDYRSAVEILEHLALLKDAHYRLLACLAVRTSRSSSEIWERVNTISRANVEPTPDNLTRYIVLFPAMLFLTILVGRELSIACYLGVFGADPTLVPFDVEKLKFWVLVSIFVYSVPIGAALLTRAAIGGRLPFGAKRYWGIYGASFFVGYAIAALTLPIFEGHASFRSTAAAYWHAVYVYDTIWPLMPAFVTAFVAFRLDSRASRRDPPKAALRDRVTAAAISGGVAFVIAMLGVLDDPSLTRGTATVVVVTTILVGAAAGWLARFEMNWRSKAASSAG
ncbi:MAG TPA: hypothetical protein VKQ29_10520 [Aliidongia sp.]|nr:hypothetical protein [Aliidongia sp.]